MITFTNTALLSNVSLITVLTKLHFSDYIARHLICHAEKKKQGLHYVYFNSLYNMLNIYGNKGEASTGAYYTHSKYVECASSKIKSVALLQSINISCSHR